MSSKKVFVVFGATGQQGGAVARGLAKDPQLSQQYHVRAVVRDPTKPSVNALKQAGCEIIQADLDDQPSLHRALTGATAAFLVTASIFDERIYEREYTQGKAAADAAIKTGLDHLIFSTLPSVRTITADRYTKVWHFDAKCDIERYIRSLPIRSSFIAMGAFMQNLTNTLKPRRLDDGTFAFTTSLPRHVRLPYIDATDASTFVRAILREPDAFEGRVIHAASQLYSMDELAQVLSRVNGKAVRYNQASAEEFRGFFEQNPVVADDFSELAGYYEYFGYFGPDTEKLIQPAVRGNFGVLTSLQEFVEGLEF